MMRSLYSGIKSVKSKYNNTYSEPLDEVVDNCTIWWGGIHSSDICHYTYSVCPCLTPSEMRVLLTNINDIYKHFYYYDLISNIEEVRCVCIDYCANGSTNDFLNNTNLSKNEIQLIRIIIQLFCKLGRKRKVTLEDLQKSEYILKGLIPQDFSFSELEEEASFKYCREKYIISFYEPIEEKTIAFYEGQNGIKMNEKSTAILAFYSDQL